MYVYVVEVGIVGDNGLVMEVVWCFFNKDILCFVEQDDGI